MKIIMLSLRGNIIGDSIREIALAEKYFKEYRLKEKIVYPCGSLIYQLLKKNNYLEPIEIKEFDMINKDEPKTKKLFFMLKGFIKILKLKNKYDLVLYLGQKMFLREQFAKLFAKLCGAKYRKSCFEEAKGYLTHINFDEKEEKSIKKFLKKTNKKKISICVESLEQERCWPISNYVELITNIEKKYQIYLLGIDKKLNKKISNKTSAVDLSNKLSIRESSLIIKNSDLYIGNDSGLAHIAYTVNTNSIMIINKKGSIRYDKIFYNKETTIFKMLNKPNMKNLIKIINNTLNQRDIIND